MFTGIIEEIGMVSKFNKNDNSFILCIKAHELLKGIKLGDSIAVNGVCLTVIDFNRDYFYAQAMPETIKRTNLGELSLGCKVNLERALALGGRFGGHFVSGHVDGTGRIKSLRQDKIGTWIYIQCSEDILKQIVFKGSIAIDGISLTVAKLYEEGFEVCVIPHTMKETNLLFLPKETVVNLECDIIGKYVQKYLRVNIDKGIVNKKSDINMEFLSEKGFI